MCLFILYNIISMYGNILEYILLYSIIYGIPYEHYTTLIG